MVLRGIIFLMASFAYLTAAHSQQSAQQKKILEELSIPDNLPVTGREAVEAVLGKRISFDRDGVRNSYVFLPDGHVRLTSSDPSVAPLMGIYGDSYERNNICFDFGSSDHAGCYHVEMNAGQFAMYLPDGTRLLAEIGEQIDAVPAFAPQPKLCAAIKSMVKAATGNGFESLIDPAQDEQSANDFSEPYRIAKVTLAGGECRISKGLFGPEIECEIPQTKGDGQAELLFDFVQQHVRGCAKSLIVEQKIDGFVESKYDGPGQGNGMTVRRSDFELKSQAKLVLLLGSHSVCSTPLECEDRFAIWFSLSQQK